MVQRFSDKFCTSQDIVLYKTNWKLSTTKDNPLSYPQSIMLQLSEWPKHYDCYLLLSCRNRSSSRVPHYRSEVKKTKTDWSSSGGSWGGGVAWSGSPQPPDEARSLVTRENRSAQTVVGVVSQLSRWLGSRMGYCLVSHSIAHFIRMVGLCSLCFVMWWLVFLELNCGVGSSFKCKYE